METSPKTLITIVVLVALALAGAMYMRNASMTEAPTSPIGSDNQVVCTQDAMQCPDGSYVGRTGPNCEFVCPQ